MRYLQISSILAALIVFLWFSGMGQAQQRIVPGSQNQMQLSFAPLVKQVAPAVVNIYTSRIVSQRAYHPFMNDPFFGQFFRGRGMGGHMQKRVENSLGSGVIVESGGLVVTNAHVIRGADEITVVLSDAREFEAELVLSDEASDLALLRIQPKNGERLPFVSLRPSETLEVGDLVLAIGNPFGVGQTVTSGIVSAQGRSSLDINDFNFFIQTDAAINPGNSGGPLVTLDGRVVGINTAIYSRDGGSLGLGFAVPSEMVQSVIEAAKMGRSGDQGVVRAWLGVSVQEVTSDIADSLGLDRPKGALIAGLHSASPLVKAGLKTGDVITAIDGRNVKDAAELRFRMATIPVGSRVQFSYIRAGRQSQVGVEAITPPEDPPREEITLQGRHVLNGATVSNINPAVAIELDISADEGVVVTQVTRGSAAARIIRSGDVLLEINGKNIDDSGDVEKGLSRNSQRGFEIVFSRNGRVQQLVMR